VPEWEESDFLIEEALFTLSLTVTTLCRGATKIRRKNPCRNADVPVGISA
jgi:hypothetical protein